MCFDLRIFHPPRRAGSPPVPHLRSPREPPLPPASAPCAITFTDAPVGDEGAERVGFPAAPHTSRWRGTPPVRYSRWGSVWSPEGDILDLLGDAGKECPPPGAESQ